MSTNARTFKGRVQNKHNTEAQWILSVYTDSTKKTLRDNPFVPYDGELIVYDPDSTYNYPRFKFGNGSSNVYDLPFVGEAERTALESKLAEKSHKHGNITNDGKLPAGGRVVVTNSSGQITTSSYVDNTRLGYLQDVTSNIQAQLDNKAASSHNQASNTITAMTGYSKDAAGGSVLAADPLNTAVGKLEKNIEVNYDKIVSRGEQLIVNGNAQLGNNTNFTSWTYDGAMANNSPGSFTRPFAATGTLTTNEYFPVNPEKTYRVNVDAKSQEGLSSMFAFTAFYDIDKNQISASHFIHNTASTTTLARDLVAGDTTIQLTDVSGWSTSFSYGFYAIVWNYTNSKGYTYPAGTYSRKRITLPKENNKLPASAINTTNKTIQLAAAYSGATIPAGTPVSQGGDGATYKYIAWQNNVIPTTWQTRTGTIGGVDLSGTNKAGMFPPGTAYCKLGFLWNYNKAQDQAWITNIEMFDTLYASKAAASGGTDLSLVTTGEKYTWNNKISSITTSAGANINKVGTPSVTASTSNNVTTLTFNYLKGATGAKGDSIIITNVDQKTGAGETSTVTFSDGKTLQVKNGSNGSNGSNGINGTSVTVSNISESTADGGSNVVTFSDGKTLTVKNGNKGTSGDIGYYIKATVDRSFDEATWAAYGTIGRKENWSNTSNAGFRDGDLFLIAGTASDSGKGHLVIYSFFKDSSTRTTLYGTCIGHHIISAKGADGKTPVKGTDYFTSTEIDSIATQAAGKVTVVDEKVKTTVRANTDTYYLTGTSGATTRGLKYDSSVHFGTESGELCMKSCNLNTSANPAKLVYDDTKKAIKFVFN